MVLVGHVALTGLEEAAEGLLNLSDDSSALTETRASSTGCRRSACLELVQVELADLIRAGVGRRGLFGANVELEVLHLFPRAYSPRVSWRPCATSGKLTSASSLSSSPVFTSLRRCPAPEKFLFSGLHLLELSLDLYLLA